MSELNEHKILVINPGSTSTKAAFYDDDSELFNLELMHPADELKKFPSIISQKEFRKEAILSKLSEDALTLNEVDCVVARGGLLRPIPSGTYRVNEAMLDDLEEGRYGLHASNLGAIIAHAIASKGNLEAFIVDPVVVDELDEVARFSGVPQIERRSIFHALNHKAVARLAATELGREYEELNFIVVHLGGGITVGAHRNGRVVDVNNGLIGEGPFAPTRSGGLPALDLVDLALSGQYSREELRKLITSNGGLSSYLGTSSGKEIEDRIKAGNETAKAVFEAMAYQITKEIGACAAVLKGKVDAILITGGLARDDVLVKLVSERVSFIAEIRVYPGGNEMKALAMGALRILQGIEELKEY